MTETEYIAALARIEILMDSLPGSVEEKELDSLTLAIMEYEETHFPF